MYGTVNACPLLHAAVHMCVVPFNITKATSCVAYQALVYNATDLGSLNAVCPLPLHAAFGVIAVKCASYKLPQC
jgi:hypothetical protein